MENKNKPLQSLPKILVQFYSKTLSRAFRKIQLFQNTDHHRHLDIRHYDLQCEAVSLIESVLQNKIQALQIKIFLKLKTFNLKPTIFRRNGRAASTFVNSSNSKNIKTGIHGLLNIGSENTLGTNLTFKPNKSIQQYQKKIRQILSKVKEINENPEYSIRQYAKSPDKSELESIGVKSSHNMIFSMRKQRLTDHYSIASPTSTDYFKLNNLWNRQIVVSSPSFSKDR